MIFETKEDERTVTIPEVLSLSLIMYEAQSLAAKQWRRGSAGCIQWAGVRSGQYADASETSWTRG